MEPFTLFRIRWAPVLDESITGVPVKRTSCRALRLLAWDCRMPEKYRSSEMAISSEFADCAAILHLEGPSYYRLDGVSWFVWRLLSTERSFDELCSAIEMAYRVPADQCGADLRKLLQDLIGKGLVRASRDA